MALSGCCSQAGQGVAAEAGLVNEFFIRKWALAHEKYA
jgi:hypothetical protein